MQKYRSHRKHLLAREAEAASWSQRRQIYGCAVAGGGGGKRDINPWPAPTIGFPPPPPPMATPMPHFRPLHVWGHPSVDQSYMHMWPKHLAPSPSPHQHPSPAWPPPSHLHLSPPADPSFWHPHHQRVSSFSFWFWLVSWGVGGALSFITRLGPNGIAFLFCMFMEF